jgi:hypothetical protein
MSMNLSKIIVASICSFSLMGSAIANEKDTESLGAATAETGLIIYGWRASKLKGADVYNDANEKIGDIDDFIIAKDGTLTFAIVNVGGFLGYGDYKVAVLLQRFSKIVPTPILPGATREKLRKLPRFDYQMILEK